MRKTSKTLMAALIASGMILTACQPVLPPSSSSEESSSSSEPSSSIPAVVQTGIEIVNQPSKLEYFVGEQFSSAGLVVAKVMSDGNKSLLANTDYTVSNPDMLTAGQKEVVVTSGNFTANFNINVIAIVPVSIAVTAMPTKTVYFVNEEFNPAGLEITATNNNGTTAVLAAADYTLSEPDMSAAGQVAVTVTAGALTASFNIVIVEAQIVSIFVYEDPKAVEYERSQDFDATGLVVAGVMDNGKAVDVTDQCVLSEPDMSTVGVKTVYVALEELELFTTFEVEVLAPRRIKPVIENFPDKVSYELGETVDYRGLKVSYLLTDGTYEEIPDINYTVSNPPSTTESGQKTITITFKEAIEIEDGYIANGDGLGVDAEFEGDTYETLTFSIGVIGAANYTYNTYTTVSPSNWNELTYQDNNDTQIMSYISGGFFTFNFAFEEGHEGDVNYIIEGGYQVEYDGVSALEDVTATYAGNAKYSVPEGATKGYAYKLTLRDDLKWDDGSAIHAEDFVYSMKQQEDPEMWNYRADSFYNGETVIHNARNYLYQGQEGYFESHAVYTDEIASADDLSAEAKDNMIFKAYPKAAYAAKASDPAYAYGQYDDSHLVSWFLGNNPSWTNNLINYGAAIILYAYGFVNSAATCRAMSAALDGKTYAEIKADETLSSYLAVFESFWIEKPYEVEDFFVSYYKYPEVNFNDVGIFVGENENDLIVVLDNSLPLLKDDGTLSYHAAYNFSGLPLVKRDLYEANKVAPQLEGGLYTSTYNSSVASSASWGPYKLTYFQAGKQYILERNNYWYGYNMAKYNGQYQTDRIVCDTIAQWNTAWLMFQKGDLASIGIDVSVADDYKGSQRAVYTADDYVGSMQLQSDVAALKDRSTSAKNKMLLAYDEFRQAISLAIDRADYCKKCTTASLAGFGLFNSMHYFDVENGVVYRDTDQAKEALLAAYGIDASLYNSLDEAIDALTGYDLTAARALLEEAYAKALAAGDITATDKVVLTVGSSADSEAVRRQFDYLKAAFEKLAEGTSLEGRLTLELDTSFGSNWANSFRDGEYDICTGGWTGATWNPGYLLMAYLSEDYMYSTGWDTKTETLTYNPWDDGVDDHELTMSLMDWWNCLNGTGEGAYDWSSGSEDDGLYTNLDEDIVATYPDDEDEKYWSGEGDDAEFDEDAYKADVKAWYTANAHPVTNDFRLGIIAQLEQRILEKCYTVPLYNLFSASLRSYKIESATNTYNTFMGYGGLRYTRYTYTDAQWNAIKSTFDYKD